MERNQKTQKLLPRQIAVATLAGSVRWSPSWEWPPAGADPDADQHRKIDTTFTSPNARAEMKLEGNALSAEAEGNVDAEVTHGPDGSLYVVILSSG